MSTFTVISKFYSWLSQYKLPKGSKNYSHVSLGDPPGTYLVPDDNLAEFYERYNQSVLEGKFPCLAERHRDTGPVVIDLDFKFPNEEKYRETHGYTIGDIQNIVGLYVKYIKYYFNFPEPTAYIFEKTKPVVDKNLVKSGVHIMFPEVITTPDIQYVIRRRVLEEVNDVCKDLKVVNNFHDIIDESVIERNSWLMYGSCKPRGEPYKLTYKMKADLSAKKIKNVKANELKDLVTYLSIRRDLDPIQYRNEMIQNEAILFYEENILGLSQEDVPETKRKKIIKRTQFTYQEVSELVSLLNQSRADNYQQWIELGWCLHNLDKDLLDIWVDFSKKSPKYKGGECEKLWDKMKDEGLYLGTLIMWAKTDNPEGYKQWEKKDISKLILNSINNFTHTAIAEILFRKYGHEYVCASQKFKLWYKFENNRWIESDDGVDLRSKISSELVRDYLDLLSYYSKDDLDEVTGVKHKQKNVKKDNKSQHIEAMGLACPCARCQMKREAILKTGEINEEELPNKFDTEEEKFMYDSTSEDFIKELTKKLQTTKFKNDIMTECREMFYDRDFLNKLDNADVNEFLICTKDGVYDLKKFEMRQGRPEDYISISTNNSWIDYSDLSDPNKKRIWEEMNLFLETVLVDNEIRHYVMKLFSSYLTGTTPDEKFHIFTGSGANGKSKVIELLRMALGEYTKIFPIELLTQKKGKSGSASPDVADGKGKRFGTFQEPGPDEKIQVGLMKEYSGGDTISCRPLYRPPIEFKPRWKLLLTCNDLPNIPSTDDGTWRRLCVVEFKSKFVDPRDYQEGNKYVFLKDRELSLKMRNWKEAFFYLLTQYYRKYVEEGLAPPDEIVKYTKMYQEKCDLYAQFLTDCTIASTDKKDDTDEKELYAEFKNWYVGLYENKPPNFKDFKEYMMSKKKQLISTRRKHFKVTVVKDDESED